jgi:hypothetical protein
MIRPGERRRLVPLVVAVCLAVFVFACSAGGDAPPERAAMSAPPRPRPRPAFVVDAAVPAQPAPNPPITTGPAAQPPAAPAPQPAAPSASITFGTVPEGPEPVPERLSARRQPLSGGSRVFSNKDLESYRRVKQEFGFRDNVTVVDLSGQQKTGPETLSPEERERQAEETRREIERISGEVQYLKSRLPSLHNPFLPRVAPSEADASAEAGMDNAERAARVTQRIATLNSEMGGLQKKLADLTAPPAAAPAPGN